MHAKECMRPCKWLGRNGKLLRRQNHVRSCSLASSNLNHCRNKTKIFNIFSRAFSNSSSNIEGIPKQRLRASKHSFTRLDCRGLIEVNGADAREYLQGLVTNDVFHLEEDVDGRRAMYAAFLSPKGRMIAEVIIYRLAADAFLIDCAAECINDVGRLLKMHKLRKQVDLRLVSDEYDVTQIMIKNSVFPEQTSDNPKEQTSDNSNSMEIRKTLRENASNLLVLTDPRWSGLGLRVISSSNKSDAKEILLDSGYTETEAETYQKWRTWYGIPEGRECTNAIPLEMNLERLNGVSFNKGCYTGQELTARTHNKGLVRKRLLPIRFSKTFPPTEKENNNENFLLPEWLDSINRSNLDYPSDKIEFVNSGEKSKNPGKIVARHISRDSNGFGLAMIRLEEHGGVQDMFLQPGHLKANDMNVWIPHLPFWWTK